MYLLFLKERDVLKANLFDSPGKCVIRRSCSLNGDPSIVTCKQNIVVFGDVWTAKTCHIYSQEILSPPLDGATPHPLLRSLHLLSKQIILGVDFDFVIMNWASSPPLLPFCVFSMMSLQIISMSTFVVTYHSSNNIPIVSAFSFKLWAWIDYLPAPTSVCPMEKGLILCLWSLPMVATWVSLQSTLFSSGPDLESFDSSAWFWVSAIFNAVSFITTQNTTKRCNASIGNTLNYKSPINPDVTLKNLKLLVSSCLILFHSSPCTPAVFKDQNKEINSWNLH